MNLLRPRSDPRSYGVLRIPRPSLTPGALRTASVFAGPLRGTLRLGREARLGTLPRCVESERPSPRASGRGARVFP